MSETATTPLPPAAGTTLVLVTVAGDQATTHRLPGRGEVVIGRSRECDVRIDEPSLSRRHARIVIGDEIAVEDLETLNGTKVRGRALKPGERATVAIGEAIDVGKVLVVVQRSDADAPSTAPNPMHQLELLVERVAASSISILIVGETGSGKEVLAEKIHRLSPRAKKPFLRLNCAAVAESLLESELFGYEKGAFTGAERAKPGLLESAAGGTVLLDEIGEMGAPLQAKLLRVIEQREVQRLGALRPETIDVRFLAATHRDLLAEVGRGTFRQDLYFRLNGITLRVPPLRERREQIPKLARELLERAARGLGRKPPRLDAEALERLAAHPWPGNVRELRNVVERALVLCDDVLGPEHLQFDGAPPVPAEAADERVRIMDALGRCGGNQTKAAQLLGMSRRTLTNRLNALGLPRPRK
jgi:DNA-binding NtrC family response regulator